MSFANTLDFERLIRELRRQKQKYHAKVLSDNAIFANWIRSMDLEPFLPYYVWLVIPEFIYAGISFSLLFDLDPSEIIPVNWDFSVELPSIDELLQGILVVINRLDLSQIYEWLQSLTDYILANIEEAFQQDLLENRLHKGVYGETRYGYSYYDPPAVREAIRGTFLKFWIERKTLKSIRDDIEAMAVALNLGEGFKQLLFNKISQVVYAQPSAFILGYGVLGMSYLGEPVGEAARMRMIDYSLQEVEWLGNTLDHAQIGLVLGVTPLGYGFLLPRETIYKKPIVPDTRLPIADFVRDRGYSFIHKQRWNPFSFANYSRIEERGDYKRSERADQYMTLQLMRYQIERIVDPIIRRRTSNPVLIRQYKNAVLQLVSLPAKRHAWGYESFKAMTEEELVDWWIRHWSAQGLNPDVLKELYEAVKRWLPGWRAFKLQVGERLRRLRYQLARLK